MSARNPYLKIIHKAGKINAAGGVSALCFKRPHAIDLSRATYTIYGEPTCPRCQLAIASAAASDDPGQVATVDPAVYPELVE